MFDEYTLNDVGDYYPYHTAKNLREALPGVATVAQESEEVVVRMALNYKIAQAKRHGHKRAANFLRQIRELTW